MTFIEWFERHLKGTVLVSPKLLETKARQLYDSAQPQWHPATTAPKDGTLFLANFGHPWPVMCAWNKASNAWAITCFNIGMVGGEWSDPYFETDWERPEAMHGWMTLPAQRSR